MIAIRPLPFDYGRKKRTLKLIFNDPTTRKSDFFRTTAEPAEQIAIFSRAFVQQSFFFGVTTKRQ